MFKNLKNKIQEETGQDPVQLPYRNIRTSRNSFSSHNSLSIDELSKIEEKDAEISALRGELVNCRARIESLEHEKSSLEQSLKAGQVQKEIFYDETDKIQNVQQQEIMKLKSMLLFREQESLDQQNKSKLDQDQIQSLKSEIARIKSIEQNYEDVKAYQESELTQAKSGLVSIVEGREELEQQILFLQREKKDLKSALNAETESKSQLQIQFIESRNEYHEQLKQIETQIDELKTILSEKINDLAKKNMIVDELQLQIDKLESDVQDKTKAIKILNQRLFDVKKTLQEEIKNNNSGSSGSMPSNAPAILIPMNDNNNSFPSSNISGKIEMDEVKFSYLKHVILKFLTSRELEAKHLIRAVSTLLYLNDSEEKLLYDTLEYRRSWFGTKPASVL